MKGSLFVISISTLIIIYELPNLKKSNDKKEIYLFSVLLLIGTILGIVKALDINIPNPLDLISFIFQTS